MDYATAQTALAALAGGTFVGMDTETAVTLLGGKKNPQQGRVTKRHTGARVMCFSNTRGSAYDKMVKRRLADEGKDPETFTLSPRSWGERIAGTAFVEHKGEHYLEVIFLAAGNTEYLLDGQPIAKTAIEGLKADAEPTGQAGLENQVVIRTFKLSSITELRAMGQTWK